MAGQRRRIEDDYDRERGIETFHTYDPHTKETTIEVVQDAAPFLRHAEEIRKNADAKKQIKKSWLHYAMVPIGIQYEWLTKHGVDYANQNHRAGVFRLLNGEYKRFKTSEIMHTVKE